MHSNIQKSQDPIELLSKEAIQKRLQIFEKLQSIQKPKPQPDLGNQLQVYLADSDNRSINIHANVESPADILSNCFPRSFQKQVVSVRIEFLNPQKDKLYELKDAQKRLESFKSRNYYDLNQPLSSDCILKFLCFSDKEGQKVYWHSSAHVLGAILEQEYKGHLCFGPPLDEQGFYYDIYMGDKKISSKEFEQLEEKIRKFINNDSPEFHKILVSKQEALELFQDNPFKVEHIEKILKDDEKLSVYRCGSFVDLCRGPHIPSINQIKFFKLLKVSQAYWLGDQQNKSLQRVYGVSFPSEKQLKDFVKEYEQLEKLDHRHIGIRDKLFFFSSMSSGSPFFNQYGCSIYNKLVELIREEYRYRGFKEVMSPNMFSKQLWDISGHSQKFQNNMFHINVSGEDSRFSLKPMNCPGHCLLFDSLQISSRDLPLRFAEFGVLHRNENSGSLHGLARARRLVQDDAHIFCRMDQAVQEVMDSFDFMKYVYDLLGLQYKLVLSLRPEGALGDSSVWDKAEEILKEALDKFGHPWEEAPGEGAFYGPKIEVHLRDAKKRWFQCATMQLDFVLPMRFNLQYREASSLSKVLDDEDEEAKRKEEDLLNKNKEEEINLSSGNKSQIDSEKGLYKPLKPGYERPVIVHRAILGSIERLFALLCEKMDGQWPFWLSPKQIRILPVSDKYIEFAEKVYSRLKLEHFEVEIDYIDRKLNKKVRVAYLDKVNYAVVVGDKEALSNKIAIKDLQKDKELGQMSIDEGVQFFKSLKIKSSQYKKKLEENAIYDPKPQLDEIMQKLNEELKMKVFLSDGLEANSKDFEAFEKMKDQDISAERYPNVARWLAWMKKIAEAKKQPQE